MKKEIKNILVILLLLIMGTISVIYYNLYIQNNKIKKIKTTISEIIKEEIEENIYQIGNIVIDKNKEEVYFTGRVAKIKGWVQFLIYVDGYKWLEEEAVMDKWGQVLQYNKRDSRIYWCAYTTVSGVIKKIKAGR